MCLGRATIDFMHPFVLLLVDAVVQALGYLETNHNAHLDNQVQIAEIPAPTFHEAERAKFMAQEFRRVGLKDVEIDLQGNVLVLLCYKLFKLKDLANSAISSVWNGCT